MPYLNFFGENLILSIISKSDKFSLNFYPTELHPLFKKCIKSFCMHKTLLFSYNLFILIPLVYIIGIKPATGHHESNFKKVGAIPCWCNTK